MLTRMPLKVLTAGGIGLLLGIGLCGLDALMPDHGQEFGGGAAFLGFVLLIVSLATVVIATIWLVIASVLESRRERQ